MDTLWEFILEEYVFEFYCILCGCNLYGTFNVEKHCEGEYHRYSLRLYANDISDDGANTYYCHLCHCYISGYRNVHRHIMGQQHDDRLNGYETEYEDGESWNGYTSD